ncbi:MULTISPECIES: I78 family peptidase inhibitor [Stenotrophomonas]|uniref:Elastase inhibitor AFLEI Flags n=2 Tax=Stenotrophomonas TaxID=40323 RepID=A0ABR5NFM9_9GAMM|nr:Elastase inhibitor AFLEI Flags: Precursor [Stenotrophomonas sp. Leaf70]KRG54011.1 Elastase inhibitor AFLEI Flags: Precursor [Stenotrophomonas nitritireducens]
MRIPTMPRALRRPAALIAALSLVLALGACKGPTPEEQDQALDQAKQAADAAATPDQEVATTPPPVGTCDASQVEGLVGQPYSEELAEQARQDAGAAQVRMLKPNQPITMEFLGERLNIEVDDKNLVSGVRCG